MPIETYQASHFADVLNAVTQISDKWAPQPNDSEELWFRGDMQGFPLLPGLYRPKAVQLRYGEENLQERFRAQGTPFRPDDVRTSWDWYFLSQHHGIPTRLLDWTQNLLVAVYFALHRKIDFEDRSKFDQAREGPALTPRYGSDCPVIWVLDAGALNRHATDSEENDCVFTVGGPVTDAYLPENLDQTNSASRYPIALLPAHSNGRLVAQQGVFTIHGHDQAPLQQLIESGASIRLAQIVIDDANWPRLWRELERMGISPSSLFPDLDSVARTIKWNAQFATLREVI